MASAGGGRHTWESLQPELERILMDETYVAQAYIRCLTGAGEPFDFRVHVQRGAEGRWHVTRIYPRIGEPGTVVSNLARGGRTADLEAFLQVRFPDAWRFIPQHLRQLGLDIAEQINRRYPFPIDELGIDLAIDDAGRTWFYEANTAPQTRDHEPERAVHTIAYARCLAQQSVSRVSPHREVEVMRDRPLIGMLVGEEPKRSFAEACASIALLHGAELVYFFPDCVLPETRQVVARRFADGEWTNVVCRFPDVIYDRLKERGNPDYETVYAELSDLPFTYTMEGGSMKSGKCTSACPPIPACLLPSFRIAGATSLTK